MKKHDFSNTPKMDYIQTLNFISKNAITPEQPHPDVKEVNLENIMVHLGGTKGEIDYLSQIKIIRKKTK
jgi:hypothetical protein